MNKDIRIIKTEEEIKVFSDPYRLKIIEIYKKNSLPMTVKNVADILGDVPAKVHYHVKKLIAIDILRLDHIEVINGINAKYYKLASDNFKVDLSEINDSVEYQNQATKEETFVMVMVEEFISNLKKTQILRNEEEFKDKAKGGAFLTKELYFDKQDYDEFEEDIKELFEKYTKKDKEQKRFIGFIGITQNEEEQ